MIQSSSECVFPVLSSDKIHSLQCDAYKLIQKNLSVMIEITSPLVKACGSPVDLNLKRFQDSSTARLLSWNFAFYANEAQSIIHKCVIPGSECRLSVLQRERSGAAQVKHFPRGKQSVWLGACRPPVTSRGQALHH